MDRINLDVYKGELFGFLWPNEWEKTAAIKMRIELLEQSLRKCRYKRSERLVKPT